MSNILVRIKDPLDAESWEESSFEGSVCDHLRALFDEFPSNARLYHEHVSVNTEVTPASPGDVDALHRLRGRFFLVHHPESVPVLIVLMVVSLLVALSFKPKIPNVAQRNTVASSPNNELSARVNSPRPNGRIPDIFGTVRSTPDLISVPYSTFEDNIEIESTAMCIGRGSYAIADSYDGDTPLTEIPESSVQVYRPNTDIHLGVPYYTEGPTITDAPLNVMRSNSVNGQTLRPTNLESYIGNDDVWFHDEEGLGLGIIHFFKVDNVTEQFKVGDEIEITGAFKVKPPLTYTDSAQLLMTPLDPTSFYVEIATMPWEAGCLIKTEGAIFPTAVEEDSEQLDLSGTVTFVSAVPSGAGYIVTFSDPTNGSWATVEALEYGSVFVLSTVVTYTALLFNLDGTYTILAMTTSPIEPLRGINVLHVARTAAWGEIPTDVVGGGTGPMSPMIGKTGDSTIGPFIIDFRGGDIVLANFVAMNGIYKDDGFNQTAASLTVELSITPVNALNVPIGPAQIVEYTMTGSAISRDQVGLTARVPQLVPGRASVMARRTSLTDRTYQGQVVDEVKWRDLYHAHEMIGPNFGNVTILRSRTVATTGALSVKERKLNLLVTREIPLRTAGTSFTPTLHATNRADQILAEVCRDPFIGNRPAAEVDYDNIYDTVAAIATYFGSTDAVEFCYTIDKPEFTFEDTVASIAAAIFSTAYRRGSVIRLSFEKLTPDSTLLFNHRNKIPGSETRTVRFGTDNNHDGLEYKWVSPEDDAVETLSLGTASTNPRRIESIGIRNANQAFWHAARHWNKIRYQNMMVEFTATAQGELAIVGDRILVADNTRSNAQDGDIEAVDGLVLTTSQALTFGAGSHTVFLQLSDGTVEAIACSAVPGESKRLLLAEAPTLPLVTDMEKYTRTKYKMVEDTAPVRHAFLLLDRDNVSASTSKLAAANYDDRYYAYDGLPPQAIGDEAPPAPPSAPTAYKHFRLYATASGSADAFRMNLAELRLRAVPSGANIATGGTASASSTSGGASGASAAFDGAAGTMFSSASDALLPQWLAYELPTAAMVVEYQILSGDTSARAARTPTAWTLQGSNDGTAWADLHSVSGAAAWGVAETRTYTIP